MSISPTTESNNKHPITGLTVEWIMDRRLVIFTIRDLSRHVTDIWIKELEETLREWPADQPYLALYDVNFPGAILSPYARTRVAEVLKRNKNLTGRTAILLPRSATMTLIQLILRASSNGKRQRRVFESREQGMKWLTEPLAESKR